MSYWSSAAGMVAALLARSPEGQLQRASRGGSPDGRREQRTRNRLLPSQRGHDRENRRRLKAR